MRTRGLIRTLALAVLLGLGSLSPAVAARCSPGPNLEDLDGDGLPDRACVGDWNSNGLCEIDADIGAAIAALDDPDGRVIELSDCTFVPPDSTWNLGGILQLPSGTELFGQGDATVLLGFPGDDVTSTLGVVSNSNHVVGNDRVVIRDLKIDGGWRGGDASSMETHHRMGVFFDSCRDCRVERVTVVDTLHSCLYARNSTDLQLLDGTLRRCGNVSGLGKTFSCVYLFASGTKRMSRATVSGIDCDGSGWAALNTRRESPSAVIEDVIFRDSVIRNTRVDPDGGAKPCVMIRGVSGATFRNIDCVDTGGVVVEGAASYASDGQDGDASSDVLVEDVRVLGTPQNPGLLVQARVERFTGRGIVVQGAGHHCAQIGNPQRGFLLEDSLFAGCGHRGISELGSVGSGVASDEGWTLRRLTIRDTGMLGSSGHGVYLDGPTRRLELSESIVERTPGHGFNLFGGISDSAIYGNSISSVARSGIVLGAGSRASLIDDNRIDGAGEDAIQLKASATAAPDHAEIVISRNVLTASGGSAIAASAGEATLSALEVRDNLIDSSGTEGVRLQLSPLEISDHVSIHDNTVRGFGRAAIPERSVGIDLQGALQFESVTQNRLESPAAGAAVGVYHEVPGSDPTYLCTNTCGGGLMPTDCFHVVGEPLFQTDGDAEGIVDACDVCPGDPGNDPDQDSVCAAADNCVDAANQDQSDADGDARGDACDNCPNSANADQSDVDQDDVGDACDNCRFTSNVSQGDLDEDRVGDACDTCPSVSDPAQTDFDEDGEGDFCDTDDGLRFLFFESADVVEWTTEAGDLQWDLYRGDLARLRELGEYTQDPSEMPLALRECAVSHPWVSDPVLPPAASIAFYLVGEFSAGEGSLGVDASGAPRENSRPCTD